MLVITTIRLVEQQKGRMQRRVVLSFGMFTSRDDAVIQVLRAGGHIFKVGYERLKGPTGGLALELGVAQPILGRGVRLLQQPHDMQHEMGFTHPRRPVELDMEHPQRLLLVEQKVVNPVGVGGVGQRFVILAGNTVRRGGRTGSA